MGFRTNMGQANNQEGGEKGTNYGCWMAQWKFSKNCKQFVKTMTLRWKIRKIILYITLFLICWMGHRWFENFGMCSRHFQLLLKIMLFLYNMKLKID